MFDLFDWMKEKKINMVFKTKLPSMVDNSGLRELNKFLRTIEHEELFFPCYPEVGLYSIIATHNTVLGPATRGIRMSHYNSFKEVLDDSLSLSRAMTYKAATAGLPYGGGKSVIWMRPPDSYYKNGFLLQFGEELNYFNKFKRYFAGEDAGISVEDIEILAKICPNCLAGRDENAILANGKRGSGDPSVITAIGVLEGIKSCLDFLELDLEDATILVHGIGKVGFALCRLLLENNVGLLFIADINQIRIKKAKNELKISESNIINPNEAMNFFCDIYSPCLGPGGILNQETIPRIKCKIVAGATNNQLENKDSGRLLFEKNIIYAPDYIINAGGLINITDELNPEGYCRERVIKKTTEIYDRILNILCLSSKTRMPTNEIADVLAETRLKSAKIAKAKK